MKSKKFISTAKDVINLEIKALQQLKKNINNSVNIITDFILEQLKPKINN